MTTSHSAGPIVSFGQSGGNSQGLNQKAGPCVWYQGDALLDPRYPYNPGLTGLGKIAAFAMASPIILIDQVPSAIATANIAALANVVTSTAMTLVSSSGAGITIASSVYNISTNAAIPSVTALAIDTAYTPLQVGGINVFDPTKASARAVSITAAASATGGDFKVVGYDLYGQSMTETITAAAGASTTNGKKAFKYISSVTPQFTDAHNYSVGCADVFGLPMRSDIFDQLVIWWNSARITATTGYVAAVTTSPATLTTGDVKGSYAVQSASDASKRLFVMIHPRVAAMTTATTTATTTLFGVTNV